MSEKLSILEKLKDLKKLSSNGKTYSETVSGERSSVSKHPESVKSKNGSPWKNLRGLQELEIQRQGANALNLNSPYFREQEGHGSAVCKIEGREIINFSNYDYIGMCEVSAVREAAKKAIDEYSTSSSASRLVAGERPIHKDLEAELAANYEKEACLVFVSGFATNMTVIGHIMNENDVIFIDSRSHNSIVQGVRLSGATALIFPHNSIEGLKTLLDKHRKQYKRALIVVEGLYSMDGDIPYLPEIIDLKNRYDCQLMVDEAHALGVLGPSGRGSLEFWNIDTGEVDIWMGTLSKTLAGSGGYIAADEILIDYLRHTAPGFVYSVGIAPALAAASLEALQCMQREPERVQKLESNSKYFLKQANEENLDTGHAMGHAIIPVMTGSSIKAVKASHRLFEEGFNVMPIIHPAVEAKAARLRFFLSSEHSHEQIYKAVKATKTVLSAL